MGWITKTSVPLMFCSIRTDSSPSLKVVLVVSHKEISNSFATLSARGLWAFPDISIMQSGICLSFMAGAGGLEPPNAGTKTP